MLGEVRKLASNEGSLAGLETKSKAAGNGTLAAQTGDAYLSQNQHAKAAELYQAALTKGGVDKRTVLRLDPVMDEKTGQTQVGIAAGEPAVWRDILASNREEVIKQLARLRHALDAFEHVMRSGNQEALEDLIRSASEGRGNWQMNARPGSAR